MLAGIKSANVHVNEPISYRHDRLHFVGSATAIKTAAQDTFSEQPAVRQRRQKKRASDSPASQERQPGLYHPQIDAEKLFKNLGRFREEARVQIERLIAFLDKTDGNSDFEPSFGCLPPGVLDETEPDADAEVSWPETHGKGLPSYATLVGSHDDEDTHHREANE